LTTGPTSKMRLTLPKPRFRLSTLEGLIALCALAMWGGLFFLSPTRRLTRQVQAEQPTYLRREAAMGLGYVPSWEADEAIDVLIGALNDPSARVRESALAGLGAHRARARRAVPAILRSLGDKDAGVRFTACAVLGDVLPPDGRGAEHEAVVAALKDALGDNDPQNRLAAALSLLRLRETDAAVPTIALAATNTADDFLRTQARYSMRRYGTSADLIAGIVPLIRAEDPARRQDALELLLEIAPPTKVRAALRNALGDVDPEVRHWAAGKLESLTPEPDR
jgi:HEAT repeat protein